MTTPSYEKIVGNFKVSTNELLFAILYGRWSLSFREEHGNCLRDDVRSLLWLHYDPPPIVNQAAAHDTSPDVSANISLLSDHYHQHQMMTPFRKACSCCTTFKLFSKLFLLFWFLTIAIRNQIETTSTRLSVRPDTGLTARNYAAC